MITASLPYRCNTVLFWFIISVMKVMSLSWFVCLSVCLWTGLFKNTCMKFVKLLREVGPGSGIRNDRLWISFCVNLQNLQKNNLKIVSHLTKTETSLVIWLNVVTIVARSVRLLLAHIREDAHATRQLHWQWWSGQRHAKHAANDASVHQFCAPATDRLAARRCPISCRHSWQGWG